MVDTHGLFFGASQSAVRIESLIACHVPRNNITEVSELMDVKWFDYRFMSPGHCFMLFVNEYHKAFKQAARKILAYKRRDPRKSALFGGAMIEWGADTIWERDRSFITSMWNAMQAADGLGIPYHYYNRLAMEFCEESKWERLARPNQLYSENLALAILSRWEAQLTHRTIVAKHPIYAKHRVPAYQDWLKRNLAEKSNKVQAAYALITDTQHLARSDVIDILSDYELKRLDLMIA